MPKNGDTTIKEGNKFVFRNGQWFLASKPTAKPTGKPDRRRTGQNNSQFTLKTTPGDGGVSGQGGGRGSAASARRNAPKPLAKTDTKPTATTTAKPPKNGDTTIKEGNKFVFNNGQWRLAPKASKPQATPATRPAATTPSRPAGTQPSRPAASRPSAPAAPAKLASPAAPKDRRVSAATANRESGNYGTSRTNNPMIDDAMKGRMRQREDAAGVGPVKDGARYAADVKSNTQGVGPVKDGTRYASNVKASPTTAGKKKEDETKTMSVAERMRRRRAGLA